MSTYYHRDGRPATSIEDAYTGSDPVVARSRVDTIEVSTVFLFINHNHTGRGAPILFETMLFCDNEDDPRQNSLTRYETEAQAIAGHDQAVAALRSGESLEWF